MKKLFAIITALLIITAMILPVTASEAATKKVAFPGANISGFGSAAGLWLDAGQYFAQAFNTNNEFVGFVMTAWASADSSVDYTLYTYHDSAEDSIDYDDPIAYGSAYFPTANPSGFEVLFEDLDEPVPAGKYVLVISVSAGRCGLTLQKGGDMTEFACSEEAAIIDNFGMDFDPTAGDATVMTGGIIFSGNVGTDAFRSITEEDMNKPADATPKPDESPAPETGAGTGTATEPTDEATAEPTTEPTSEATADTGNPSSKPSATPTGTQASPSPAGTTNGNDGKDSGDSSNSLWIIIAVVAAVVIIAIVVIIIVVKNKKK